MADDTKVSDPLTAERQARALAALLDEAAQDLERNGAVPPAELRRRLEQLELEWAGETGTDATADGS
jgi:hypothetical protein